MQTGSEARRDLQLTLVCMLGFFAIAAQTLLFRSFLDIHNGSEFGIALFFGSWLIWVALGALFSRLTIKYTQSLSGYFDLLTLLYIPSFILQHILITHAHTFAGVAAYEAFPFLKMLPISMLVNAPTSIVTGWLFPLACQWLASETEDAHREKRTLPVASVYISESLGAFGGGVTTTLLLMQGYSDANVFCLVALVLSLIVATYRILRYRQWLPILLPLIIAVFLISGSGQRWTESANRSSWNRLMEPGDFTGSFTTAQTRYLYGTTHGQMNVLAWGSIVESVPQSEHAAEVAALTLAQRPDAKRVLIIGSGSYSICDTFARFPSIEHIIWLTPDPQYTAQLTAILPEKTQYLSQKIEMPQQDINIYLRDNTAKYDLIAINLPDPDNLILNRYFTAEFYQILKSRLEPGGIVCARVSANENYLSNELGRVGASAYRTLNECFSQLVIKPGDESWIIASDTDEIIQSPQELRKRFNAIAGARKIFPPNGLLSLYPADRAKFQIETYKKLIASCPTDELLNTEQHPRALLHTLTASIRQQGAGPEFSANITLFAQHGLLWILCALLLFGLLRLAYGAGRTSGIFDSGFLVCSTGTAALALNIVLMFAFQSRFGSIFLHIGLLSSLFMLGLFFGSILAKRILAGETLKIKIFLFTAILAHAALCLALIPLSSALPHLHFFWLFLLCGGFGGIYVPVAAKQMQRIGLKTNTAGSIIDACDHLGGAIGGIATGLILLPLLGTVKTLITLAALLLINIVTTLSGKPSETITNRIDHALRTAGYLLFGIAAMALIISHNLQPQNEQASSSALHSAARLMAPNIELRKNELTTANGQSVPYFKATETNRMLFIFSTRQLAPQVNGYNGPIDMAVMTTTNGIILNLHVIDHCETPYYMRMLSDWIPNLRGADIFNADDMRRIDAVSGATVSSAAILQSLRNSGKFFTERVLNGVSSDTEIQTQKTKADNIVIYVTVMLLATLLTRRHPGRTRRRLHLAAVAIFAGFLLNIQYSLDQVLALIALQLPPAGLQASFVLTVGIPLLTILFGNIYCGYLCPFGALQELIGDLIPAKWLPAPRKSVWRYTRSVKYILLFTIIILFAVSRNRDITIIDPLVSVFSSPYAIVTTVTISVLALSLIFKRFWCRNLCPAGAFLAVLNRVKLLRILIPGIAPAHCDLGVNSRTELDCISCDRCRDSRRKKTKSGHLISIALPLSVLIFTILWLPSSQPQTQTRQQRPAIRTPATPKHSQSTGKSRDIDIEEVRQMIENGQLSSREALYYE